MAMADVNREVNKAAGKKETFYQTVGGFVQQECI